MQEVVPLLPPEEDEEEEIIYITELFQVKLFLFFFFFLQGQYEKTPLQMPTVMLSRSRVSE